MKIIRFEFSVVEDQDPRFDQSVPVNEGEDEMLKRAIAMSLEQSRVIVEEEDSEEEMLTRVLALSMVDK